MTKNDHLEERVRKAIFGYHNNEASFSRLSPAQQDDWRRMARAAIDAIAMETRQGGDVQQAPSRSDDSAGRQASPNPKDQ